LGIAALSTIATSRTDDALGNGALRPDALVTGFQAAFFVGVVVAVIGIGAVLTLIRRDELEHNNEQLPATEPALELAA
jgi:hypothetical protein